MTEWLQSVEGILLIGTVCAYLTAMVMLWLQLFFRADEPTARDKAMHRAAAISSRRLLIVGASLHLLSLCGQGNQLFSIREGVAGLFGWILVVAYLTVERRWNLSTLGVFVTPVALLAALYSLSEPTLHSGMTAPENLESPWLVSHVVLILIGYVALAFAFAASMVYLLQDGLLKRRQLTGLWQRLPSLQVADDLIYRATTFGLLVMMALGIFTGVVWEQRHQRGYSPVHDPKVLFSIVISCTFGLYLASRVWLGWGGRRSNLVVVYGFVLLAISFFGVPHLLTGAAPRH